MHTTPKWPLACALILAAPLAAVACGGDNKDANQAPQPTAEPSAAPPPTAQPSALPTAEPSAAPEASAAPSASPSASAAAAADKPKSSGRPPVLVQDPKSITQTLGFSPGAKLELGEKEIATLRIPEGAFTQATNVTFELDTKCKSTGLVTGKLYKITPTLPPDSAPQSIPSNNGSPYILVLPTNKKKDVNLAIGNHGKDAKGNDSLTWKIVAPAKTDDAAGTAEFQLDKLPDACIHLTNKAPN